MARMRNEKRSDGRVQSKIYLGLDKNGKKKYKYVYASNNRELEQKVEELKVKLGKGIDLAAQDDLFGYWVDKWLKYKKNEVSASWHATLTLNANKLDDIRNIPVSRLTAIHLKDMLYDLAERGLSQRVVKAVRDIASGVMELAISSRIVDYNPFRGMTLPKCKSPKYRGAITLEQQKWIRETEHRAQIAAMIMLYAGLRRGELIPLLWSDIDLENGIINVTKSVEMIKGRPVVKEGGKTDSAYRRVYIPKILTDYLSKQSHSSFIVCPTAKGKMHDNSSWRRMWESYMSVLNFKYGDFKNNLEEGEKIPTSRFQPGGVPVVIEEFTPHQLRHTFITLMYFSGVDLLTAKEQAGHSDIKVTADIYTHLDAEYKAKQVEKLDEYLSMGVKVGVKTNSGTA